MTIHKVIPLLAIGALALGAGSASAQTAAARAPAAAAPAATPIQSGPPIAGVCIFSNEAAIGTSAVGKYVGTRIQQIAAQANAELKADQTALQTDAKTFEAQRATMAQDVQQQKALALQQRDQALQRKAEQRNRELQATEQKALARVAAEMNPLLRQVYTERHCSLLLDRNAVFVGNPSMDMTSDVVKLLDAKITQFPFEREHLDQAPAPAAGQGAAPGRR